MDRNWPPDGYSQPREWEESKPAIVFIAVILAAVFTFYGRYLGSFKYVAEAVISFVLPISQMLGFRGSPVLLLMAGTVTVVVGVAVAYIGFQKTVVPLHEKIHYKIDDYYDLNPEYVTVERLVLDSPAVVPLAEGITKRENVVSAIGPFVVIGVASFLVSFFGRGWVSVVAVFILILNSMVSAGDLYNVCRVLLMPEGTLYENFKEEDGEIRTEFVYPED